MSRGFLDEDGPDNAGQAAARQALGDCDLAVRVLGPSRTGKAVLIDDGKQRVWLPCKLLRVRIDQRNGFSTITVPEWFAKKEGLI